MVTLWDEACMSMGAMLKAETYWRHPTNVEELSHGNLVCQSGSHPTVHAHAGLTEIKNEHAL